MTGSRAVLGLGSILLLAAGCSDQAARSEPPIRPVRYEQVFSTGSDRVRTFSGVAEAKMESRLSFKVGGTVREVPVEVGDTVVRGQLLASLDPEDYELQVQEAEASLTRARAEARKATTDYERVRSLYENRNASRSDLDAARAASESANAIVRSGQKRLELARLQVSYTRLTAPSDGAIAAVDVEVNENVDPGESVVTLTAGSDLEVMVAVPEAVISLIREGDQATVRFDARPGEEFTAVVTEVGVSATRGATTYPVTVDLAENHSDIRPGMAAQVGLRFEASGGRERFLVPPEAVGEDRQGRFVFLVESGEGGLGVVRRTDVTVGDLTAAGIELTSGVKDGDLLVTAGVSRIQDGWKVKLTEGP